MLFQMAGDPFDPDLFREIQSYHQKHIDFTSTDHEPYYWIGVIDWTLSFPQMAKPVRSTILSVHGKQSATMNHSRRFTRRYSREYGPIIDEGNRLHEESACTAAGLRWTDGYLNFLPP